MTAGPFDLLIWRQENKKAFIEYRLMIKAAEGGLEVILWLRMENDFIVADSHISLMDLFVRWAASVIL